MIARMGTFVEFSVFGKDVSCDWSIISISEVIVEVLFPNLIQGDTKELTIKGGHLGPNMWPQAIEMIAAGELPVDEIVTHMFPLQEFKKGIDQVKKALLITLYIKL